MKRARATALSALVLFASCSWGSPLDPGMRAVEAIRGRRFAHPVRNVTIDRSELAGHLREQMIKSTPYSMEEWGTVLRALQLVDLEPAKILPNLISLYESQVLAFYDPHAHVYYSIRQLPKLPDTMTAVADPEMMEETVMVHELMHALQDQHFALSEREKALMRDADANLAYHAVLEGEAVLVMVAHMLKKSNVDFEEVVRDDAMLGMMTSAVQADTMMSGSTPRYFAEMLKFPYLEGLKFVIEAYRRGGWRELDRLHQSPPKSTREILHPEDYFSRSFKPRPFDPKPPAGAITAEHLGEFHWRFLVGTASSAGWVDDRAVVYRDGRVDVRTEWEKPEQAAAFAEAYAAFLKGRGLEAKVTRTASVVTAAYRAQ